MVGPPTSRGAHDALQVDQLAVGVGILDHGPQPAGNSTRRPWRPRPQPVSRCLGDVRLADYGRATSTASCTTRWPRHQRHQRSRSFGRSRTRRTARVPAELPGPVFLTLMSHLRAYSYLPAAWLNNLPLFVCTTAEPFVTAACACRCGSLLLSASLNRWLSIP